MSLQACAAIERCKAQSSKPQPQLHQLLTPAETAVLLSLSPTTLRYWRRIGAGLAAIQIGPATFRYDLDELTTYLAEHRVTPRPR